MQWLFSPAGLTAHGFCLLWEPWLVGLHAGADIAIGLAYFTIPVAIAVYAHSRRDMVFAPVAWLFAGFIVLCGTGHFLDLVTLWVPIYRLEGLVKAATAVVSVLTVVTIWLLMPKALALPSMQQIRQAHADLRDREAQITAANRSVERLRDIIDASPTALLLTSATGVIQMVNAKAIQLFGYGPGELRDTSVELLLPEHLRAHHVALRRGFMADMTTRAMGEGRALLGLRKDGSTFPVEIALNPTILDGEPMVLVVINDITERVRAQDLELRMAALVESASDPIITKRLDGIIQSFNPAAERLLGYRADEIIGLNVARLIPDDRLDEEAMIIDRIVHGQRVEPFETVRRTCSGALVDVSLTVSPIRDHTGTVVGASKIMRDIAARKRIEAELRRSNADLEQFAYIASHDLQEPLRMVASYTELLGQRYQGKLDAKADKFIFYATDGARRMQALITDLLTYSRVGAQGRRLVAVSSAAVLDDTLQTLATSLLAADAVVDAGPLPTVLADDGQLRQLFQNLIANAIKFRHEARTPHVRIEATRQGEEWLFSVADNGIGLEMQYAERIFQMFQRLHERGRYDGSGIGLAIARRIVERHGGKIWLESEFGAGTTFFFTLAADPDGDVA